MSKMKPIAEHKLYNRSIDDVVDDSRSYFTGEELVLLLGYKPQEYEDGDGYDDYDYDYDDDYR